MSIKTRDFFFKLQRKKIKCRACWVTQQHAIGKKNLNIWEATNIKAGFSM